MRVFHSGASRNDDANKIDYEGHLSPIVLKRYCEYMHKHRKQSDGSLRDSDNWQLGMDPKVYMKSLLRHLMTLWLIHRDYEFLTDENIEDTLSAIIFNASGYLHEILKKNINNGNQ